MTASRIFLYFCLAFIIGIFLSSISISHYFSFLISGGILILGILLISTLWRHKKIVVIGFCLLFLVLGIWRHQATELKIINDELKKYNDLDQKITLIGIISAEPDTRERSQKLTIKGEQLISDDDNIKISGKILITIYRYPEYEYGDKLKITGELKTPQEFEDFNYRNYLKKDKIYSVMSWPKIEIIAKNQGSPIYAKILFLKEKLRKSIYQNLSPPQSSILGAMILGDKRKLSGDLKEKLNIAGVRHITAISGLHVAVLTAILMSFLLLLGFWRQQAFYFTLIFIIFFIIMTGLQPSAIRAGIMGGLFLLSQYFGRMSISSRTIVFAAALMLAQNPLLLKLDVGFQLSFLAMMGIIYLLPTFRDWLKFIPWENPKSILAMTFSAYLFTLPILIYNFGYISLVAPITNLLIVPFLYWIMLFGFLFGLTGIIWQFLGWILSFPAWFLLTYLVKIIDWFSEIPWAYKTIENIHWLWLIISYLILGYFAFLLNQRKKLKSLRY